MQHVEELEKKISYLAGKKLDVSKSFKKMTVCAVTCLGIDSFRDLEQKGYVRKPLGKMKKSLEFLVQIKKFPVALNQMAKILGAPENFG